METKSDIVQSSRELGHHSDGGKETTAASGPSLRGVNLSDPQRRTAMGERVKKNVSFFSVDKQTSSEQNPLSTAMGGS